MSLTLPNLPRSELFKKGYSSYESEDGAVLRNIDACRAISKSVETSLGPYGRNKIVVNHLRKMILTNDAATILRELDVVHPAARLIVLACQQQEKEMGDATNFVIVLAGELLRKAEELLRIGLRVSDIIQGFSKGQNFALQALEGLRIAEISDMRNQEQLRKAIRTVVAAKQSGKEDEIANLISEAVVLILPESSSTFNVDNIRVIKILGGHFDQSRVVRGMVFGREPEGLLKSTEKAKVAIFSCPIDVNHTETRGTVLLRNAKEMMDFTHGEESQMEQIIRDLYNQGIRVVVGGSTIGEVALHFLNRFGILAIKVLSKFDLRRLSLATGAAPLARLGSPMPDEVGYVDHVDTLEIGGDRVTIFRQETELTRTVTLVLRGATQNYLDDLERAIDDGINVVKAMTKDARLVPGAGAAEIEMVEEITAYADKTQGLAQYAIRKYGEAFEIIPRILADSAGLEVTEVLAHLYLAHSATSKGKTNVFSTRGVDLEDGDGTGTLDAESHGILDSLVVKKTAIQLASDAVKTILGIDQVIVARQAGGPKMPQSGGQDWDVD